MNKKKFILLTSFLVFIEQIIKLIINENYLDVFAPIIKPILYFRPMFNRDYSWINSLFQLGVGKWIHVASVLIISVLVILVYNYISFKNKNTKIVSTAFAFLLAGGLCSLIDKIFWNGSLDYIYLSGQFTFDLKDAYINIFIGLVVIMFIKDHQNLRTKDDDKLVSNFLKYLFKK